MSFSQLWNYLPPSNILLVLLLAGLVFLWFGWKRTGKTFLTVTGVVIAIIITLPVSGTLMTTLEKRFPQPDLPAEIDGIIVLGGAIHPQNSEIWGQPQFSARVERLTEGAVLAQRYPDAKLVFTGGKWEKGKLSEADVAHQFFQQWGLPEEQLVFENQSSNTFENAKLSKNITNPQPGEVWVLVTSAFHMPRSIGVFRKAGWDIIAYPVDYYTGGEIVFGLRPDLGTGLATFDFVSREWVALLGYYLKGQTSALFPGPAPAATASGAGSETE